MHHPRDELDALLQQVPLLWDALHDDAIRCITARHDGHWYTGTARADAPRSAALSVRALTALTDWLVDHPDPILWSHHWRIGAIRGASGAVLFAERAKPSTPAGPPHLVDALRAAMQRGESGVLIGPLAHAMRPILTDLCAHTDAAQIGWVAPEHTVEAHAPNILALHPPTPHTSGRALARCLKQCHAVIWEEVESARDVGMALGAIGSPRRWMTLEARDITLGLLALKTRLREQPVGSVDVLACTTAQGQLTHVLSRTRDDWDELLAEGADTLKAHIIYIFGGSSHSPSGESTPQPSSLAHAQDSVAGVDVFEDPDGIPPHALASSSLDELFEDSNAEDDNDDDVEHVTAHDRRTPDELHTDPVIRSAGVVPEGIEDEEPERASVDRELDALLDEASVGEFPEETSAEREVPSHIRDADDARQAQLDELLRMEEELGIKSSAHEEPTGVIKDAITSNVKGDRIDAMLAGFEEDVSEAILDEQTRSDHATYDLASEPSAPDAPAPPAPSEEVTPPEQGEPTKMTAHPEEPSEASALAPLEWGDDEETQARSNGERARSNAATAAKAGEERHGRGVTSLSQRLKARRRKRRASSDEDAPEGPAAARASNLLDALRAESDEETSSS